ncbi:hypothetical protein [Lentzea sp. NPDC092896]|uniref:hypothetical protein n=1 Tax=Lentzea sp. NPDC092896 TaxID=3364127 RepID=UPI0038008461
MSPDLWPALGLPPAVLGLIGMAVGLQLKDQEAVDRVFRVCRVLVVAGLLVWSHALTAAIAVDGVQW